MDTETFAQPEETPAEAPAVDAPAAPVEAPAEQPAEAETAAAPVEQPAEVEPARTVIASPSRNADGTVTHADDAEIPDPDAYAEHAARQIESLGVDSEQAAELAKAEATRGGQQIETASAPPAGETA